MSELNVIDLKNENDWKTFVSGFALTGDENKAHSLMRVGNVEIHEFITEVFQNTDMFKYGFKVHMENTFEFIENHRKAGKRKYSLSLHEIVRSKKVMFFLYELLLKYRHGKCINSFAGQELKLSNPKINKTIIVTIQAFYEELIIFLRRKSMVVPCQDTRGLIWKKV